MGTLETPEFIYFDLGKVLLEFSHDRMLKQMGEEVGLDQSRVRELVFESGLSRRYECGEIDSQQFCQTFFQLAEVECDTDQLLRAGSDIFSIRTEMLPLIVNLSLSGMGVGILSNTCPAHWEFIASRFGFLSDFFSPVILSYEVGVMKPDPRIYELAAERAGTNPSSIFYVDDLEENVRGAKLAGWDASIFQSAYQVQQLLLQRGVRCNF